MTTRRMKNIPLQEALDYVLDSDLDSSSSGMSNGEEELDELLIAEPDLPIE